MLRCWMHMQRVRHGVTASTHRPSARQNGSSSGALSPARKRDRGFAPGHHVLTFDGQPHADHHPRQVVLSCIFCDGAVQLLNCVLGEAGSRLVAALTATLVTIPAARRDCKR